MIKKKMELLSTEEKDIDECGTGRKENVLIRFCRKKYKCVMMFLCIIALVFQTIYLVIEKIDSEHLGLIMTKLLKNHIPLENKSTSREAESIAEYG